jgi:hypothetical protein
MEMVAGFGHITAWHFSVTKPYGINGHVSSGTPAGNHTFHSISPPAELRPARILLWRPGSEFWCDATHEALNWAFQDPRESDWKPMVIIVETNGYNIPMELYQLNLGGSCKFSGKKQKPLKVGLLLTSGSEMGSEHV